MTTGKPICSEATLQRLMAESASLIQKMEQDGPPVGDAVFVAYDEAFAKKHEIGRFGRMTQHEGNPMFYAAPCKIEHKFNVVMDDYNLMDYWKRWSSTGDSTPPVDRMLQGPQWPEFPLQNKKKIADYERELFLKVGQGYEITLVNPSFSTMVALKTTVGGFVTLTTTLDHDWVADIIDFAANSGGKIQVLEHHTIRGVAYLGTNVPVWYPPTNWLRLVISPFLQPSEMFPRYTTEYVQGSWVSRYEKKRINGLPYVVTSMLDHDTSYYLYNPETVDRWLSQREGTQYFFLESAIEVYMDQVDDYRVKHSPRFINVPKSAQWARFVDVSGVSIECKSCQNVVYDVKGSGTYLSRRNRTSIPSNMIWAPYVQSGTHWITVSSLKPSSSYGIRRFVKAGREFLLFGDSEPVFNLHEVLPQDDECTRTVFSVLRPPVVVFEWPLDSDEHIVMYVVPKQDRTYYLSKVYTDDRGRVWSSSVCAEDGVVYAQNEAANSMPIPLLPRGDFKPVRVFRTKVQDYVVVESLSQMTFAFPRAADILSMGSSLALFGVRHLSVRSVIAHNPDTESGAEISTDVFVTRVHDRVMQEEVHYANQSVSDVSRISRELGAQTEHVYKVLQRLPGVVIWKPGDITRTQFVHETQIKLRVLGELSTVSDDGKSWLQLMRQSVARKYRLKFTSRGHRDFMRFLRYNFHYVQRVDDGIFETLIVHRPY